MSAEFDPHMLYTDSIRIHSVTEMTEDQVRAKALQYKKAERDGVLQGRQEEERARLFGHFLFELSMQVSEREQLEKLMETT